MAAPYPGGAPKAPFAPNAEQQAYFNLGTPVVPPKDELYAGIAESKAGLELDYDLGATTDPTQLVQQHRRGRIFRKLGRFEAVDAAVTAGATQNTRYVADLTTGPNANARIGTDRARMRPVGIPLFRARGKHYTGEPGGVGERILDSTMGRSGQDPVIPRFATWFVRKSVEVAKNPVSSPAKRVLGSLGLAAAGVVVFPIGVAAAVPRAISRGVREP